MELYVVAGLSVGCIMLALYLLARRIRMWKEQILRAISIVESNNAIAHQATRGEIATRLNAVEQHHARAIEAVWAHLEEAQGQLECALRAQSEAVRVELTELQTKVSALRDENDGLRNDVNELVRQTNLRRLAGTYGAEPRVIGDNRPLHVRFDEAAAFLRSLDGEGEDPEAGRAYLETHLPRLARTLDITPLPQTTRRALELGAYMQMTPALQCVLGYEEVRGGYLGTPNQEAVRKTATVDGKAVFSCRIDYFDAERDPFPYDDGYFDVVLACEIIEHLRLDPMHMLLEARRVLAANGTLILTTPSVASYVSVARAISGVNPQVWSRYPVKATEIPHVREYTPSEIHDLMAAAGFAVERLFTEPIGSHNAEAWLGPLFDHLGYPKNLRGEQIYLVARKRSEVNVVRRPEFLYE